MKRKTDNTQAEALRSSGGHIQDIRSGVYVTTELAKLKDHKLVVVKEQEEYLAHAKCEVLAVDAFLLRREFKNFKSFFAERAEIIYALRKSLPVSGRKCKVAVVDEAGNRKVFSWSEFCLEFWGVSAHWVRKQLCMFKGLDDEPNIDPQQGADDDLKPDRQEAELDAEEKIERAEQISTRLELDNRTGARWTTVSGGQWTWRGLIWCK